MGKGDAPNGPAFCPCAGCLGNKALGGGIPGVACRVQLHCPWPPLFLGRIGLLQWLFGWLLLHRKKAASHEGTLLTLEQAAENLVKKIHGDRTNTVRSINVLTEELGRLEATRGRVAKMLG